MSESNEKPRKPIIGGYVNNPTEKDIDRVNEHKALEELLLRRCEEIRAQHYGEPSRMASIAITHFEIGFMLLNRAVFRPQRVKGEITIHAHTYPAEALKPPGAEIAAEIIPNTSAE